ncbi:MerR family transcriptional regulator [Croceicoccus naphthovorans]|uniref:MerR family transcriptional regulator n=1 Tax=Croceicoccus naphthovorans TaxID=1348774 RepID=A0A0G3XFX7_9SPHN|nr:MerR family transcriptional regulator [Croceicoccus naphthovorans]AKM10077.1 MerR family transcriptional regulator [Croceicoccus naphthovorans]MBB3991203.1 MerR family mercuric resistance operon transcriptional regulator [Croceicoccus naphthovorans]
MVRSQTENAAGKRPFRISELAAAADVGVETVRFYQRKGLLPAPTGPATGGRHYGDDDVQRLRFIRQSQAAGFRLSEIKRLLDLDRMDDRPQARAMAQERIAALDLEIARLEQARASLKKLASECAKGGAGPCPILSAFDPA